MRQGVREFVQGGLCERVRECVEGGRGGWPGAGVWKERGRGGGRGGGGTGGVVGRSDDSSSSKEISVAWRLRRVERDVNGLGRCRRGPKRRRGVITFA